MFIPNCQYDSEVGKYRVLQWNIVGSVFLRKELNYVSIDVEFMNKAFHRNLSLNDDYGVSMAAINYSGMIVASKGEETDLDKYEEDEEDEDMLDDEKKNKKKSNIYFRPFNEWKNMKEWNYSLENGENTECLAIGTGWCAASTDFGYIRVFSNDGI